MILRSRAPALPGLLTRLCYSRLAAVSDRFSTLAANDGEFVRARHRTLAIPATVTPVANYPRKLRIYRTNASPYPRPAPIFITGTISAASRPMTSPRPKA